ncbi:MAG: hypothetical protein L6Q95_20045, partial [Planctomycetes bacterium]|nr:hypothetical protein [Planctomycetota bacterium]
DRTPALFVEATALGEDLDDRRWVRQVMTYATVAGVEWVVLTNGDGWRLYNAHAKVPVEEKLFRSVKVTEEGSAAEETLRLLARDAVPGPAIGEAWRRYFIDRRVLKAMRELLDGGVDAAIVKLVRKRAQGLTPAEVRSSLARARVTVEFPPGPAPTQGEPAPRRRRKAAKTDTPGVAVRDLIDAGLVKPPVDLFCTYKGKEVRAHIEPDGRIRFGDQVVDSLSTAAGMARVSVAGKFPGRKYPQTNGWDFWHFRDEGGRLRSIGDLRQEIRRRRTTEAR